MIETKLRFFLFFFFFLIRCWHFFNNVDVHEKDVQHAARRYKRKSFSSTEGNWLKKRRSKKRNNLSSLWSLAERQEIDLPAHADLSLCRKNILVSPFFPYIDDHNAASQILFNIFFLKDTLINWYKFIFTKYKIYDDI